MALLAATTSRGVLLRPVRLLNGPPLLEEAPSLSLSLAWLAWLLALLFIGGFAFGSQTK